MPRPLPALVALASLLALARGAALAQPTYKLEVKPEFAPRASLSVVDGRIVRTDVANDPGFRLQLHVKKDGRTVAIVEARSESKFDLPAKDPGDYTATLELFYPAYKGGNDQKGQFRPVSWPLHYRVEAGSPPKVTRLPTPPPPVSVSALLGGYLHAVP